MTAREQELIKALRDLCDAAEALADSTGTLPSDEMKGNQRKVTPANMFLSVGNLDVREAIQNARKLIN